MLLSCSIGNQVVCSHLGVLGLAFVVSTQALGSPGCSLGFVGSPGYSSGFVGSSGYSSGFVGSTLDADSMDSEPGKVLVVEKDE
jgi:hypothetical protein